MRNRRIVYALDLAAWASDRPRFSLHPPDWRRAQQLLTTWPLTKPLTRVKVAALLAERFPAAA